MKYIGAVTMVDASRLATIAKAAMQKENMSKPVSILVPALSVLYQMQGIAKSYSLLDTPASLGNSLYG
jgi:hypothetical protein